MDTKVSMVVLTKNNPAWVESIAGKLKSGNTYNWNNTGIG